jgi:hypothetical protein
MTESEKLFHQIAKEVPNAREGKAFGVFCIKAPNGKLTALFWKNNLMFKLNKKDEKETLNLKGARPGTHIYVPERPMTGWVKVPLTHSAKWKNLTKKSISYVMKKK